MIEQEIALFQRNNDLGVMMGFLRGLEGADAGDGVLTGELAPLANHTLEEKMKITPPKTVGTLLPALPDLPSLKQCRKRLIELIDTAYQRQGNPDIREFVR